MKSPLRIPRSVVLAALAFAALPASAFATAKTYEGANGGNFNVATNWSPSGVPTTTDDATLGNFLPIGVTGNMSVTLNSNISVLSITLNSSSLPSYMILNQTAGTLTASVSETIGTNNSDNIYNQTGGTNNTPLVNIGVSSTKNSYTLANAASSLNTSSITLGVNSGTSGNFIQTDGNVTVNFYDVTVGSAGTGVYTQSGGTVDIQDGNLTLASASTSSGTFNLSGSAALGGGFTTNIGIAGTATFNQTGGSAYFVDAILSSTLNTATYNFSGGLISTSTFTIGNHGTFNLQSGGSLTIAPIVNTGGTLDVAGGSFGTGGGVDLEGGTFQLQGNSVSLSTFSGNSGFVQNGALLAATLTIQNGAFTFSGVMRDGPSGTLGLTLSNASVVLGGASTYSGPTTLDGELFANTDGAFSPNSSVTMDIGSVLQVSTFTVAIASISGGTGTEIEIAAAGNLSVGNSAASTFSGVIIGPGNITKTGSGCLTLSATGNYSGTTTVISGILANGMVNGIPPTSALNFGIVGTLNLNFDQTFTSVSSGVLSTINFSNTTLTFGGSNGSTSMGTNFNGTGNIVKNGTGTVTLGYGVNDSTLADADTNLNFILNNGTLQLFKAPGSTAFAGNITLNGGTLLLGDRDQIADSSTITINNIALFNLNGQNETITTLVGTTGTVSPNGGTLTITPSTTGSFSGALTTNGGFVKGGAADFTLSNISAYTGAFSVTSGRLILQNVISATSYSISSGATLRFSTASATLNFGAIQPASGGTVEYLNSSLIGGFLDGPGTHSLLAGANFLGTTFMSGAIVNQSGATTFTNVTSGATLTSTAPLTWTFGTNAPSGVLTIDSTAAVSGFTNSGVINIASGATLTNSISSLTLSGGSRTFIGTKTSPGGTLILSAGTTLEVNGALLVNDGTISGTTDVNYGGQAQGIGTYGTVNVTYGGIFQPGFASSSIPGNGTLVTGLSGNGTIDNLTAGGNMNLILSGSSNSTFSGPIQNTTGTVSLSVQGTSSLTLLTTPLPGGGNSANTYSGGTSIASGGTLLIGATGALPSGNPVQNNGAFLINATSTSGQITGLGALSIGSGATLHLANNTPVSQTASLALNPTGFLDLTNTKLIVEDTTLSRPADIALLKSQVSTSNIYSATATATNTAAGKTVMVVAVVDNGVRLATFPTGSTNFGGINNVDASSILITAAFKGDANLDGVVDIQDLTAVANHWQQHVTDWSQGDFDGNGIVDIQDLTAVANNWQAGVGSGGGSSESFSDALTQIGRLQAPTPAPEPASLALLLTLLPPILTRRPGRHA